MHINDCNQYTAHDSHLITCWIVISLRTLITLLTGYIVLLYILNIHLQFNNLLNLTGLYIYIY